MPELSLNQDTYTIKLTHDEAAQLLEALRIYVRRVVHTNNAPQPIAKKLRELLEGATR